MWQSIKKFFKRIADCTGISWIARKISSGWKWLFGGKANATQQNTSQQEGPSGNERQEPAQAQSRVTTTSKTLDDEVNPDQSIPPKQLASSNKPNSNDNIFNQQSAGPVGLFQSNYKEPQPTTPNQLVNQDNIAGQDSSKIGETQNSPTTDLTTEQSTSSADKEEFFDAEDDGVT